MCGIAGYFGKGDEKILAQMIKTISYRGPDDFGIFSFQNVGLAHARLAIIDLSSDGHQPMSEKQEKIWLVFNGEIYNFQELREELVSQGIEFKSQTDTEVIIHLYDKYGLDFLNKLNGMFALAIFDKAKNQLCLARDRFGEKPLYYRLLNGTLLFGSELKALQKHPDFKSELDLESLNQYLQFEYVPTPRTIFKNTSKLEPGSYLVYNGQEMKKGYFWNLDFKKKKISKTKAENEFEEKLERAVKTRMVSDVPLGIFLSGGIDSSAIAYFAQKNSNEKVHTFSIGFEEKSFDESSYARLVSNFLGTIHHEHIIRTKDCLNVIPEIYSKLDEPMADPSILPSFLLSKFAKEKITVALGGDGGDELLCGYDTFVAEYYSPLFNILPASLKTLFSKASSLLPTSFTNISLDFKIKKFFSGFSAPDEHRHFYWLGSFNKKEREKLFKKEHWEKLKEKNEFKIVDSYSKLYSLKNKWDKLIALYLRSYLMDDILVKMDRASMFNSLEVRTPFLDFELVEFLNSLPAKFKIKRGKTKIILKNILKNKIPKEILKRRKKGFGIPLANWLENDLKAFALEKLSRKKIEAEGIFDYNYIENILNSHFNHKKDYRKQIWTLLVFEMWYENFLKNSINN